MSEIKAKKRLDKVSDRAIREPKVVRDDLPNPVWFKPVMFGFMLLGLAWILLFYISGAQLPLGAAAGALNIGNGNILVGFGIFIVGFVMATRWK